MATKDNIKITISSGFDAKGVQAAIKAAQDLKAAYAAVAKAQTGGGNQGAARAAAQAAQQQAQALGQVATAAKNTDASLLRLARAQATLASAQGDAKGAANAYAAVLPKLTSGSLQAIQAQTGLQRALNAVNKSAQEANGGLAVLPRTIAGLSGPAAAAVSNIQSITSSMAAAGGALAAGKMALDLAQVGAAAEAARVSFDKMAAGAGTSGDALLASLQKAAGGTVAATDLIQNTNTALLLLGNDVATKLPALLEVARASAQATGQDVGYVFQSLVTGISRGSTELIDNAGITLSASEAYAAYAASIGKSAEQLTKAERSQAILNGVLTAGQTIVQQSGTSADSAAVAFQQMNAAIADAKVAAGQLIAIPLTPYLRDGADALKAFTAAAQGDFSNFGSGLQSLGDVATKTMGQFMGLRPILETLPTYFDNLGKAVTPAGNMIAEAFQNVPAYLQSTTDAIIGTSGAATSAAGAIEWFSGGVAGLDAATGGAVGRLYELATGAEYTANSVTFASSITDAYAAAAQRQISATAEQTTQLYAAGGAFDAYAAAATNGATETERSAELSAYDAQMKAAQAAELELAQLQAQALADAFIDANPNISASGAASAAAAAGMSPLIARLIEATLRAREAAGALAAFNALGGIAGAFNAKGIAAANIAARTPRVGAVQGGGAGPGRPGKGTVGGFDTSGVGAGGAARASAMTGRLGTPAPPKAPKGRGGGGGGARAAGGGGGAGGAAASEAKKREAEATKNAERLAQIESQLGAKLADIDTATQEKLAAIDARAAEKRAEAARKLNEQIGADASGYNFDETLNDFDLFNSELDDKQRAALEAREAAEANYQQRVAAAGEEARQMAANGEGELAQEIYQIKKEQAQRQKEIEERAAQAVREGGEAEAVAAKAAEATAASEAEANRQIAIAQAAAEARKAAVDEEKNAAIAASQEQRNAAVEAANEAAAGISNAANVGTAAVIAGYNRQMEAIAKARRAAEDYARTVRSLPAPPTTNSTGGTGAATTGGGGTTLRATNEQGISAGKGGQQQGAAGASAPGSDLLATIQDALAIIIWLDGVAKDNAWNRANTLPQFVGRMQLAIQALNDIVAVHDIARTPVSPLNPETIRAMVKDMTEAVTILGNEATPALNALAQRVSIMANAAKLTTELLAGMAEFRKNIRGDEGKLAAPIPAEYIQALVDETVYAVDLFQKAFARSNYGADFRDGVGQWVDNAGSILDLLNNAADLGNALKEPSPLVTVEMMQQLARTTEQAVQVVLGHLVPLTGQQRDALTEWSEQAGAALELLKSAADLNTADIKTPIPLEILNRLAITAQDALNVIAWHMQPLAAETVTALKAWTEGAGAAIDILSSAAGLASDVANLKGDGIVPLALLQRLAATSKLALQVVQATLGPMTEEQVTALERWASSSGAAVDTISAVAGLYADVKDVPANSLSANLLIKLAEDARLAVLVAQATLIPMTEEQSELLQRWGDATRASTDALTAALDLRQALADSAGSAPPTEAMLLRLADDGYRALMALETKILPVTEEMNEAYDNYAGAIESATSGLSAAFSLSGSMFADYQSPSDAQLNLIAADAQRVVKVIDMAARTFSTEGLEAAQQFGDAYGSIVSAFTEGLTFNAALASGDFTLDTGRLATFVDGARQMIRATTTLGAEAAAVPAEHIAALNNTSSALIGFADAAIKMNAVPLNVPQFAQSGGGGGGTSITFAPGSIVVQAAQGMNVDQVANLAVTKIEARLRTYR